MASHSISLLPSSLKTLIKNNQFNEAEMLVKNDQDKVRNSSSDIYTQNRHMSELYFQQAVIADAKGLTGEAFKNAKLSFKCDARSYPQHETLIEIALKLQTEESLDFVCEVANWFLISYGRIQANDPLEFWSEKDIQQGELEDNQQLFHANPNDINTLLEHHRHIQKIEQLLLEDALASERLNLMANTNENDLTQLPPILKLCDDYVQKGINEEFVKIQKTSTLFSFGQYDDIVKLWQNETNTIKDIWPYARLLFAQIKTGQTIPTSLTFPAPSNTQDYYNLISTFWPFYLQLCEALQQSPSEASQEDQQKLLHEKNNIERLLLAIGNYAEKYYQEVLVGERIDGYINDAHFYAMFCRNFSLVIYYAGDLKRALNLAEKGFFLSPFIENGRGMINYAIEAGEYERAAKNILAVRSELGGYLDSYDSFYLECRELCVHAAEGVAAYIDAEQLFMRKHGDFIHNMRINALTDARKRPTAVIRWTQTHNLYAGNAQTAAEKLYKENPIEPYAIAYYFKTQALSANKPQVEWSKTFAQNLDIVRNNKSHPDYRKNLFTALAGYGFIKLKEGVFEKNHESYSEGIALLEEAVSLEVDLPREKADCYVKLGKYLFLKLSDYQKAETYLTKAITLLEQYGTTADSDMGFLGDPMLALANWYRGQARLALQKEINISDKDILNDFIRFKTLSDSEQNYLASKEIAYLLIENEQRLDEFYENAIDYINEVESINKYYADRGDLMSLTVMNLLLYKDMDRALPLYEKLKLQFPNNLYIPVIEKEIRKINKSKRKKFLGIF